MREGGTKDLQYSYRAGNTLELCPCRYVCMYYYMTTPTRGFSGPVQLNGIGRMRMNGASGCRQTVMNDPGAQQLSQMFYDFR